jgi:hypothetical protein
MWRDRYGGGRCISASSAKLKSAVRPEKSDGLQGFSMKYSCRAFWASVMACRAQITGQPEMERSFVMDSSGTFETGLTLRTNDVWLATLNPR